MAAHYIAKTELNGGFISLETTRREERGRRGAREGQKEYLNWMCIPVIAGLLLIIYYVKMKGPNKSNLNMKWYKGLTQNILSWYPLLGT